MQKPTFSFCYGIYYVAPGALKSYGYIISKYTELWLEKLLTKYVYVTRMQK